MGKLGSTIAIAIVLLVAQAADAKQAHAEAVSRELVHNGPATTAKDWLPEGKPGLEDHLLVPAGKTLEVLKALSVGSLVDYGSIARSQAQIIVRGDFELFAPVQWEGELVQYGGLMHLVTSGNVLDAVMQKAGIAYVEDPLTARYAEWFGSLVTDGQPIRVLGLAYPMEGSFTSFGTSTVEAGEWLAYPLKAFFTSPDTLQQSMESDLIVRGEPHSTFKPAGHCWRSVLLEAGETMFQSSPVDVEGRWEDNTPALTVEHGSTMKIEGDTLPGEVVIGPRAQTIRSTEPGVPYTLELPYPLEATTTATVSDLHVLGATLTLHGATDGGGDEGVIFAP